MAEGEPYTLEAVQRLLGFREGASRTGLRHITVLDLFSWSRDPGGDHTWSHIAMVNETGATAWMARRGPIGPASTAGCILWDFQRAMKRIQDEDRDGLAKTAILALTVFGFSSEEIALVLDFDKERDWRRLNTRRKKVDRTINGRAKRDTTGEDVRDDTGAKVMVGSLPDRVHRALNEPRKQDRDLRGPRPDEHWQ